VTQLQIQAHHKNRWHDSSADDSERMNSATHALWGALRTMGVKVRQNRGRVIDFVTNELVLGLGLKRPFLE